MSSERTGQELDAIYLSLATVAEKRKFVEGMTSAERSRWLDAVFSRGGGAARRNKKRSTRRKKRRGKRSRNYKTKR